MLKKPFALVYLLSMFLSIQLSSMFVTDSSGNVIQYQSCSGETMRMKGQKIQGCYTEYSDENFKPEWIKLVKRGLLSKKLKFCITDSYFFVYSSNLHYLFRASRDHKNMIVMKKTNNDANSVADEALSKDEELYSFLIDQEQSFKDLDKR
jgi:hypothetical protein